MLSTRNVEELRLLAKVAQLYHSHGLNQREIAQRLDLSQATVSRLLKRAEVEGVVRITVSMPAGVYSDLEEGVRLRYGLHEAIVIDAEAPDDEAGIQRGLGAAAAFYLENTLKPDEVIGISSGARRCWRWWTRCTRCRGPAARSSSRFLGGIGRPEAEVHASRLTDRLAKLVNGTGRFLMRRASSARVEARDILLDDPTSPPRLPCSIISRSRWSASARCSPPSCWRAAAISTRKTS